MNIEEKKYWVSFNLFGKFDSKHFFLLKDHFGSAKDAWQADLNQLKVLGFNLSLLERFIDFRKKFNLDSYFLRLCENKIECQTLVDKNYPKSLKNIDNPPILIYVKGKFKSQDELSLAVVGTRKASSYGLWATQRLVADLACLKITIVSGLARGIDTIAHRTALKNKTRTIAVLGCGIDQIYPPENFDLAQQIIAGQGAIISEYGPGTRISPYNFPARNRLVAGLSLGTLVTEAPIKSGALITARFAADQGKEVFAVPGLIDSFNGQGTSSLIKDGAKLVWNVDDILEELNLDLKIKDK